MPTNPGGDAGDPVLARNNTTGRLYFATLGFSVSTIQVFRSDDDGATWIAPVNGTPGGSGEDKEWIAVDNFEGPGNGNVYIVSRRFGADRAFTFSARRTMATRSVPTSARSSSRAARGHLSPSVPITPYMPSGMRAQLYKCASLQIRG